MFPMSIDQIKIIVKLVIFGLLIIGSTWYIYHLKSEVQTQKTTIATLNGTLLTQNQAITDAGNAKKELQTRLDNIASTKNVPLAIASEKIKTIIIDRPVAATCDAAVSDLKDTAKAVALDWNSR